MILFLIRILLAWLSVFFVGVDVAGAAENLLRGRHVTLSTPPNYPTAGADAETLLTDGREAVWPHWRNGTSLGWAWRSTVIVSIDLNAPTAIERIRIQAGAKRSGEIYFPSQLLVYGGDQSGRMAFLGASVVAKDEDSPWAGTLRKFEIRFKPRMISRVILVAFARGPYLFLGEIEAFGAPQGAPLEPTYETLGALRADALARRKAAIAALAEPKPTGPSPAQRWAMPLALRTEVPAIAAGEGSCVIDRIEPWPDLIGKEQPVAQSAPLIALSGGRDYAAFQFVNRTTGSLKVRLAATDNTRAEISFYALAHAQALNYAWVADVVAPIDGEIELPHGSQLLALAEVAPKEAGEGRIKIETTCGSNATLYDMPLTTIAPTSRVPPLHATMWAYLHQPEQRMIAQALVCDPAILSRLGLDTQVVHPDALYDTGAKRPDELLRRYFRAFRGAERVLLWMDVKTRPWIFKSLPDNEAAASLKAWWDWVAEIGHDEGVGAEILLYPIDEPQPEDVPLLLRTHDLFRKAGVSAKIYSTVEHGMERLLPWLDVMQLHRPWTGVPATASHGPELQAYDTRHDGKLIAPNSYYRMQGWQAFQPRLAGVGLWALWDSSGHNDPASGWSPFDDNMPERDFGLLYASPEGCAWPSRRLIAWRRGVEENRILRTCSLRGSLEQINARAHAAISAGTSAITRETLERVIEECGN